MSSFQGVSNGGQLPQQLTSAARRQNPAPASVSTPASAGNEAIGGNGLPPAVAKVEFSEPVSGDKQIQEAVAKLSDFVQSVQRDLSFSVDDSTGETIITVIDSKTDEVVRQIPSEYVVRLAQNLNELQEALSSANGSKGNLLEIRV